MVEVTVDQAPRPQLPYDPNDIPEAVRRRVAATDALYTNGNTNGSQPSPTEEPVPEQLTLPLEAPAPQAPSIPPANTPAPATTGEENSETWKSRYYGLQGRFTASQKTIGELQEQMVQLGNELVHTQRTPPPERPRQQEPPPRYVTDQDVQDYGVDLLHFTQRAAAEAIAPQLQALDQQNRELQDRLAQEARARLDMRVEASVPNFREIDRDPRWHRWLLGVDVLSGRVRQTLLNEAISSAQAPRVISFFKGFLSEEEATGHADSGPSFNGDIPPREPAINLSSLAAPGRARPAGGGDPSMPSDRPIYTRAQINQYYAANRRGAYVGREAEWSRQEADIIAAGREGRVR